MADSIQTFPLFLNIEETRKVLSISRSSILRHIKNGKIPYVKLGRRVLIPREAIEALVKKSFENCVIEYPLKKTTGEQHE